jgi:hypothetical protein
VAGPQCREHSHKNDTQPRGSVSVLVETWVWSRPRWGTAGEGSALVPQAGPAPATACIPLWSLGQGSKSRKARDI